MIWDKIQCIGNILGNKLKMGEHLEISLGIWLKQSGKQQKYINIQFFSEMQDCNNGGLRFFLKSKYD